jgi:outer membrane protein assembly factor BamB
MKTQGRLLLAALSLCAWARLNAADDWPQWRGPKRDDISHEAGLRRTWPKNGPPLLWTFANDGLGYSGPSIVGNQLFIMGAREGTEFLIALDVATGKQQWSTPIGKVFDFGSWGGGPRGTPTVDGDYVYALGGQGELICAKRATGEKVWHLSMQHDLGGKVMSSWGYTESPLIDGDKLVCSPGGSKGTIAALDKHTGKVIWRSKGLTDPASYSSLVPAQVDGIQQYVQLTGNAIVGVAAEDGHLLWRHAESGFRVAVIPTAICRDHYVYATTGYGFGCDLIQLKKEGDKFKTQSIYANKIITNHHGGVVLVGEHLYGYSDHERGWICQDFKTGKLIWSEKKKLGKGSLSCVDGRLICYSEEGGVAVLIEATPEGWKEHGRFKIPRETTIRAQQGKIWTHPVVANGRLYLRDQDLLFCFDLREETAQR